MGLDGVGAVGGVVGIGGVAVGGVVGFGGVGICFLLRFCGSGRVGGRLVGSGLVVDGDGVGDPKFSSMKVGVRVAFCAVREGSHCTLPSTNLAIGIPPPVPSLAYLSAACLLSTLHFPPMTESADLMQSRAS